MWCGVIAVSEVTGWTRGQVWLHLRWWRERQCRPFRDKPYGGTNFSELRSAVERAGYSLSENMLAQPNRTLRRVPMREFCDTLGREGVWLIWQLGHFFAYRAREHRKLYRTGNWSPVLGAYRVTRLIGPKLIP